MTAPQRADWQQRFLNAYKNNTGDARLLALQDAWGEFIRSDDYPQDRLPESEYAYWTALADAAEVEQQKEEERNRLWVQGAAGIRIDTFGIGGGGGVVQGLGQGAQGSSGVGILGIGGYGDGGATTGPLRHSGGPSGGPSPITAKSIVDWIKSKVWVRTDAGKEDEKS